MYPKASHVGFGLVLGEDGKRFRTRNTEVVRLVDLLDEAKNRSKSALIERGIVINVLCFSGSVTDKSLYNYVNLNPDQVRLQNGLSRSLSIPLRQLVMELLSKKLLLLL